MDPPLRTLSLCTGIGGLDLGLTRALRVRPVAYAERDSYAAAVLLERMEEKALEPAPVWIGDLADMDARPLRGHVDLVCAGYPCQPFSTAGRRAGAADPRHLWPAAFAAIRSSGARAVVLENVRGHVQRGLDHVLWDLADLGFNAEWGLFRACEIGAPHPRPRLFIVAHADGAGVREQLRRGLRASGACEAFPGDASSSGWWASEPPPLAVDARAPAWVDQRRCLGNAVVPQQAELAIRELVGRLT